MFWARDDLEDSLRYVMSLRGCSSQKLCDAEWCEIPRSTVGLLVREAENPAVV